MNPNPEVSTAATAKTATNPDSTARSAAFANPFIFNPPFTGQRKNKMGMRYAEDQMRNFDTQGLRIFAVSGDW